MAKSYICVFDCETIPDVALLRKIYGYAGDDMSVCEQAFAAQKATSGSEFLPVMFHRVVAISAVMADEYGKFMRVRTLEGANEQEILSKFIKFINDYSPRLVSFNGRGFDLPMIMTRAMRYNLTAGAYFETENRELNKNKWENYRSRYDGRFHLDLLDHVSDFGAVRGLKLDTLCASLNLPGKYDVHGDQVMSMFFNDKISKINEYCESDTLNTYWLFLKYELLRGNLRSEDYASYLGAMSEFLLRERANMSYTDVFCAAIEDELARLEGSVGYDEENFGEFDRAEVQNGKPNLSERNLNGSHETRDFNASSMQNGLNLSGNLAADEVQNLKRIDPKNLDDHLAKSGLDGLLKKGGGQNLKKKERTHGEDEYEDAVTDELPEINLDDE